MHRFLTGCGGSVSVVLGVELLSNLGLALIGSGTATMSGSGVADLGFVLQRWHPSADDLGAVGLLDRLVTRLRPSQGLFVFYGSCHDFGDQLELKYLRNTGSLASRSLSLPW